MIATVHDRGPCALEERQKNALELTVVILPRLSSMPSTVFGLEAATDVSAVRHRNE